MASRSGKFNAMSFAWRFLSALCLVIATYNPTGYSYFHWFGAALAAGKAGPEHYFVGVVLIIAWIMFVRATLRSLGGIGILLGAAFFATLLWLLTARGIVPASSTTAIVWISLVCLAGLLAAGMSWSHIRRRLSGQVDVDEIEDS